MGLSEGCVMKNQVLKDQVVTYEDVIIPSNRLCDALRTEQNACFL